MEAQLRKINPLQDFGLGVTCDHQKLKVKGKFIFFSFSCMKIKLQHSNSWRFHTNRFYGIGTFVPRKSNLGQSMAPNQSLIWGRVSLTLL